MKTPEQIADEIMLERGGFRSLPPINMRGASRQDVRDAIRDAIEADRAQREHPMSDPLIELREWASTVSQFMAEDKSNDWREEIAQLQVIEERLDGEA